MDESIGRIIRRITAGEFQANFYHVTAHNLNNKVCNVTLEITPPEGWKVDPEKKAVSLPAFAQKVIKEYSYPKDYSSLTNLGEKTTQVFSLQVPFDAKPGGYKIKAELKKEGRAIEKVYLYDVLLESPIKINYWVDSFDPGNKIEVTVTNPGDKAGNYQVFLSCPDLFFEWASVNLKMKSKETVTTSFVISSRKPTAYNHHVVTAGLEDKGTGKVATLSTPLSCRLIAKTSTLIKIDGNMDDWKDAYPVNLSYPMPIAGKQWKKVAGHYCPDVGASKKTGYAGILCRSHGKYTGYSGSIYFKSDDEYFYGFLDIKDNSVFGMEQGRIDPACGLVDYGDSQIIMFDTDNDGVIAPDEYAFMLFPFGPIHLHTGDAADPYPVIIPVTTWIKEQTSPLPEDFDRNCIQIASKMVKDEAGKESGYRIEFSIPLKKIGIDPKQIASGISLQLESTDVTDEGALQSWLWNNPTTNNFLGTMEYKFLK